MKKTLLLLTVLAAIACGSQKNAVAAKSGYTINSPCPENGICKVEVQKDSALVVKTDEATGKFYYEAEAAPGKSIVTYSFTKNTNPRLADDGYIEKIVFETTNDFSGLKNIKNIEDTKMLFGVMCFCKGKAGFYKVKEGTLTYKKDQLKITLPDIIDKQKLKNIDIQFNK